MWATDQITVSRTRWPSRVLLCLCAALAIIAPLDCPARERLVLEVVLNMEKKGEFFVCLAEDGDCLLDRDDLVTIGFADPMGVTSVIEGKTFISLKSMEEVTFTLDEQTVSLEITAAPRLLRKRSIDLRPARRRDVYYPKDTGAFFNYGLSYTREGPADHRSFAGTTQLGLRVGDMLLLNDSMYKTDDTADRLVRLSTNVTYESRLNLNRAVLGDLYATSGYLGGAVNMGGISLSRNFSIDPYFIKQPMVDYTGFATLPSDVRVSVDGAEIRSDRVGPGPFDLRNVLSFNGLHDLEITVKDAFGREETLRYPFYSSDVLLRSGLHEFSYNAGFLRKNYGTHSNDYGRFAFSFLHNYGITDSLTVGLRGEGLTDLVNIGLQMSFLMKEYGVLSLSGAATALEKSFGTAGYAGSLRYSYQRRNVSLRFLYNIYTREYSTLTTRPADDRTRYEVGTGIGYSAGTLGSISFDFGGIGKYAGQDRQSYTLSYTRNVARDCTMHLSLRHTKDSASNTQLNLGFTFHLWKNMMLSANLRKDSAGDYQSLQIQKNAPAGEGFGYRVSATRDNLSDSESHSVNPYVQYNGPYGIYSAEFSGNYPTGPAYPYESTRLNASGGIAYVGRTIAFGRPVSDSYAVVKVGDLRGVRVYHNNLLIGHTDTTGKIFIPDMNSYRDNYISINDKDIPVEYSLEKVAKYVAPPLRSGTFLFFDAVKLQAFTGHIEKRTEGRRIPLSLYEATLTVDGMQLPFVTDGQGEFYLENIPPGSHHGTIEKAGKIYYFTIRIPRSDDPMVDLGGILAEDSP